MIRRRHWTIAVVTAVALHAFVFSVFAQKFDDGADLADQKGIEVELGMLGDLGGAQKVRDEENEPQPSVAPPVEPEPVTEPEPIPEPEPEPVQKAEVQVQVQPEPKPKPKPISKPEPRPEPKPEPVSKAVSTVVSDKPVAADANPAQASAASSETARPGSNVSGGSNAAAAASGARKSWYAEVAAHLARHKHYPMRARRMRHEAIVTLRFVVERDGSVRQSEIIGPSEYRALNQAVEEMLERAQPLPPIPKELPGDEVSLSIPVAFKLQ